MYNNKDNTVPIRKQKFPETLKICRANVLYDDEEIEKLKNDIKRIPSDKQLAVVKMQKDIEKRLRTLARENFKIKTQLEAERRKNRHLLDTKAHNATEIRESDVFVDTELEKTCCTLDVTNDKILSGLTFGINNSGTENGSRHDSEDEQLSENNTTSDTAFCTVEDWMTVNGTFDFLDCTINTKGALTSTQLSINKKRRESRRQTIFDLLQENSTYKKQLQIERKRSTHNNKDMSFLGDKINEISAPQETPNLETCKE